MTISSQIIEVLNDLCTKFGFAVDWSQENILPYLQELVGKYISWEMATSWAFIVLAGLLVLCAVGAFIIERKAAYGDGFGYAIAAGLVIAATVVVIAQVMDILTCQYFPEKQVVDYIVQLMQEG